MNRHVKAHTPALLHLAQQSKYASLSVDASDTVFTKRANIINLDSINHLLVEEAMKLGSAVLQSISASTDEQALKDSITKLKDKADTVKESFDLKKSLLTGAALSAVPLAAANYTLNKASDDLDSKMLAIPGIAAATVGAILAARNMSNGSSPLVNNSSSTEELATELQAALNAKEVVDSAIKNNGSSDISEELQKMSSISTEHIASLLTEILL